MIGYLRGKILNQGRVEGRLLVAVGSSAGDGADCVGYSVTIPHRPQYDLAAPGHSIELFIYTHVREDALDLYGFIHPSEKELFLTLLSVNGIGPKGAMSILSGADPQQLLQAILDGDKESLTRIPGIGKKTAERVVLELADPVRKKMENGVFSGIITAPGTDTSAARPQSGLDSAGKPFPPTVSVMVREAREALVGLGYREPDVLQLLNRLISETDTQPTKVEELIRTALRHLA